MMDWIKQFKLFPSPRTARSCRSVSDQWYGWNHLCLATGYDGAMPQTRQLKRDSAYATKNSSVFTVSCCSCRLTYKVLSLPILLTYHLVAPSCLPHAS